jgi:membrane associated rhomboid family serine protease
VFYAIPLESRPSWRNPPWATILLIVLNMVVFWGPQRAEERAEERAARFYAASSLPALELPAFVDWLATTGSPHAERARRLLARQAVEPLLDGLQNESRFLKLLHDGVVVTPAHPQHAQWQQDRAQYEQRLPPPFTRRWAQDYSADAELKPWTWLTAAFLHGSTGHLLGNMLFLFLFGFSVELALGRGTYLAFYLVGAVGAALLAGWAYAGKGSIGLGASGAVSALMGMYAVLYRLRRIRFFYQLFFYFNYVTAPALILLPAWIANELHAASARRPGHRLHGAPGRPLDRCGADGLPRCTCARTRPVSAAGARPRLTRSSCTARRRASYGRGDEVRRGLRAMARRGAAPAPRTMPMRCGPGSITARLQPASDDFHRAAQHIFRLQRHRPGHAGTAACQLPHLPRTRRGPVRGCRRATWHGSRGASHARSSSRTHERLCRHPGQDGARPRGAGRHAHRLRHRPAAGRPARQGRRPAAAPAAARAQRHGHARPAAHMKRHAGGCGRPSHGAVTQSDAMALQLQ